jgi:hypothetical protein
MGFQVDYNGHEIKVNNDLQLIIDDVVNDEWKSVIGIPFLSSKTLYGEIKQGTHKGAEVECLINYTGFSEKISIYVNNELIKKGKLKYGLNGFI